MALSLAQAEALHLHHGFIGPEHLLLGLIRDQDSQAGRVFRSLGVDLMSVRKAVEALDGPGNPAQEPAAIDLTADAMRVLQLAKTEAEKGGSQAVGAEHLLLGLAREPGRAATVLESFGISPDAIRASLDMQLGA